MEEADSVLSVIVVQLVLGKEWKSFEVYQLSPRCIPPFPVFTLMVWCLSTGCHPFLREMSQHTHDKICFLLSPKIPPPPHTHTNKSKKSEFWEQHMHSFADIDFLRAQAIVGNWRRPVMTSSPPCGVCLSVPEAALSLWTDPAPRGGLAAPGRWLCSPNEPVFGK